MASSSSAEKKRSEEMRGMEGVLSPGKGRRGGGVRRGAPGVVNGSGGLTASTERLRASRPCGARRLREYQREEEGEADKGPGVAATHGARALARVSGSTRAVGSGLDGLD